jgi:hypothetical protein
MEMKYRTRTVEVICIVEDPTRPSYRIGGVAQRHGDRGRLPLDDARELMRRRKARIVEGSEKMELWGGLGR